MGLHCSVDSLRAFVQQYLDGALEPFVKSEPVPESNDAPVKVVGIGYQNQRTRCI